MPAIELNEWMFVCVFVSRNTQNHSTALVPNGADALSRRMKTLKEQKTHFWQWKLHSKQICDMLWIQCAVVAATLSLLYSDEPSQHLSYAAPTLPRQSL